MNNKKDKEFELKTDDELWTDKVWQNISTPKEFLESVNKKKEHKPQLDHVETINENN
jgi:hypothetical protein